MDDDTPVRNIANEVCWVPVSHETDLYQCVHVASVKEVTGDIYNIAVQIQERVDDLFRISHRNLRRVAP